MIASIGLLTFKCVEFNKTYEKKFDEDLFKRLENTYCFSDVDFNKFCVMLWKGVYLYKYMDSWARFSENCPQKNNFTAT